MKFKVIGTDEIIEADPSSIKMGFVTIGQWPCPGCGKDMECDFEKDIPEEERKGMAWRYCDECRPSREDD